MLAKTQILIRDFLQQREREKKKNIDYKKGVGTRIHATDPL